MNELQDMWKPWDNRKRIFESIGVFLFVFVFHWMTPIPVANLSIFAGIPKESRSTIAGVVFDVLLLLLVLVFLWARKYDLWAVKESLSGKYLWIVVIAGCLLVMASDLFVQLVGNALHNGHYLTDNQAAQKSVVNVVPWAEAASIVVLGPIFEEILFRGLLLKFVFTDHPIIGLVLTNIFFGQIHAPGDWLSWVYYVVPGIVFTLVYYATRKLEAPILVHSITNLIAYIRLAM